jgi:hypothetical protein
MRARHSFLIILAVTIVLLLPSIAVGFFADDYFLSAELAHRTASPPPPWDLYRFAGNTSADTQALVASGALHWWTSPAFHLHLIRPLTSLLFALDAKMFGSAPLGYHVVSIGWYLALVTAVGALFRRLLPLSTASLATFLFAVDPAHTFPWAWVSSRHMTIAATFCVLSLLALVRAREASWRAGEWLAALALSVGLAGGETAIGGVAYVVAYAAAGAREEEPWRRRIALISPVLAVTAVYIVLYALAGGGTGHGGGYVSPLSEPLGFARVAARRLFPMLADATLNVPPERFAASVPLPVVVAGLGGCAVVFALGRAVWPDVPEGTRAALRWLVPGALLALLAALGGFLGSRLRLLPDLGFAALFSVVIQRGLARATGGTGLTRTLRRTGAGILAAIHVVVAPLLALTATVLVSRMARQLEAVAHDLASLAVPGDRVFVMAASDPMVAMYPPVVLIAASSAWKGSCWSVASMAKAKHRVTHADATTLSIEPEGTTLLTSAFETLFRAPDEHFRPGDSVTQCGARYLVTDVRDGRPSRIELTLDSSLDDPHVRLLVWDAGRLRRFVPPPLGGVADIAWSRGPMGL